MLKELAFVLFVVILAGGELVEFVQAYVHATEQHPTEILVCFVW
jgi:hypothetical protein